MPSITKSDNHVNSLPVIAAIDIGTNTIRLLIGRLQDGRLRRLRQERVVTCLGKGLSSSGHLDSNNAELSITTLNNFKAICQQYSVGQIIAVGTSALREALDSMHFLEMTASRTGIIVDVISGEAEAALTIKGILSGQESINTGKVCSVIADIGGGSTEIIATGKINAMFSIPIGAVKLFEQYIKSDPPTDYDLSLLFEDIRTALDQSTLAVRDGMNPQACKLICTGGTPTTLAAMSLKMESYDGDKVHGVQLPYSVIHNIFNELVSLSTADRQNMMGLEPERADIIIPGTAILIVLMRVLGVGEVTVSDFGLLEGIINDQLKTA